MTPNLKLAEVCALAFLETFGEACTERPKEVLRRLGLEIEAVEADSFDGALLRVPGAGTIVVNTRIRNSERRRFTIWHEVGHFVLPNQQDLSTPCAAEQIERGDYDRSRWAEAEANRFAAEVLMPRSRLTEILRTPPTFESIRAIADVCAVSLTAAAFRLTELTSHRVAVVWSKRGEAVWYSSSQEFGRAVLRGSLSDRSYAYDVFQNEAVPERLEYVPATAWLRDVNLREGARILEHSFALPSYEATLSLLVIPERIERHTDFDEEDEDALDPNEFTLERRHWPTRRRSR